jgi:hypothetical protein
MPLNGCLVEVAMILSADEVIRSINGSMRLIQRRADGLKEFDVSFAGFWRSFATILLATPALLITIADQRLRSGDLAAGALFGDAALIAREAVIFAIPWVAFPILMIGFVRMMHLSQRYVGYVVAYNWSAAIAALMLAGPALLHVLGLATPALATFYTFAFAIILIQYRWFLARSSLEVTGGVAMLVVGLDIVTNVSGEILALVVFG